jgi:hypothetical protein
MSVTHSAIDTLVRAVLVPIGLLATLLLVRIVSYVWYVFLNRRPLPIIVNDVVSETGSIDSSSFLEANHDQSVNSWEDLPVLVRNYISIDPPLSRQLAPGVTGTTSPAIAAATPTASQFSWTTALVNLVLPQKQAAYNIYITPNRGHPGQQYASVQIVKTPEQWIKAAKSFKAGTLDELAALIGGFCMECVQLQPEFLRRTPRWEHWGSRGGYATFRRAVAHQEDNDFSAAHGAYEKASGLAPGNIRLGEHRASLYEIEGKYQEATLLYDALHCLWKKNIEVLYRSSATRVNRAQELLLAQANRTSQASAGPEVNSDRAPSEGQRLIDEAQGILEETRKNLHFLRVLKMWLKTWLPRRRDIGERRYWASWLQRDKFRQPLMLLRRSKRYEYVCAVKVTLLANEILAFLLSEKSERPFAIKQSVDSLTKLIKKKRIGWLAHWVAACYFSRAAAAADRATPEDWRQYSESFRKLGSPAYLGPESPQNWQECCQEMAIGEIGRVLRNPCNQLNPQLFATDPDMKRLHEAFKGAAVRVLIGPIGNMSTTSTEALETAEPS